MLCTVSASTSGCVSVYVAVHVVDAPGSQRRDRAGHRDRPSASDDADRARASRCRCWSPGTCTRSSRPAVFPVGAGALVTSVSFGSAGHGRVHRVGGRHRRRDRVAAVAGGRAGRRSRVLCTVPGVHVGLRQRVRRRAGRELGRSQGRHRAVHRADLGVGRPRPTRASRCRCWSPGTCTRSCAPATLAPGQRRASSSVIAGAAGIGDVHRVRRRHRRGGRVRRRHRRRARGGRLLCTVPGIHVGLGQRVRRRARRGGARAQRRDRAGHRADLRVGDTRPLSSVTLPVLVTRNE